jgi:V-type H+-transporting ATPase subunit C
LVPKNSYKEWSHSYHSLEGVEHVLPDYTELIAEDKDYGLFNVVLLKKIAEDYKKALLKNRFIVREFKFDSKQFEKSKQSYEDMKKEMESMKKELMHWCKTGFSEAFSSWIHVKTIRTYAESVLRYGVPPRFVTCLLHVEKNELSIHKILKQFYNNIEEDEILKSDKTLDRGDNFPYVLIKINTNYPLLNMK